MIKLVFKVMIILLFIPSLTLAKAAVQCKDARFLQPEFNFNHYQQCKSLIKQCPTNGPLSDQSCVNKIVTANKVCNQLNALAIEINGSPAAITAEKMGNFVLIDQIFIADGQNNYYIASPKACIVKTNIDPREINPLLKKRYVKTEFMTVNDGKPVHQTKKNGQQSFTAKIKITENCLACKVIGSAKIKFNFAKDGKLLHTSVVSFVENKS